MSRIHPFVRPELEGLESRTHLSTTVSGWYGFAQWDSDYGRTFSSGVGYNNLRSNGSYSGTMQAVSHGQSPAVALQRGSFQGNYTLDATNRITMDPQNQGYVSTNGNLCAFAPVPGDRTVRETGLGLAVKLGTSMTKAKVQGRYYWVDWEADRSTIFNQMMGYADANGKGSLAITQNRTWKGQATGYGMPNGKMTMTYNVASNGAMTLAELGIKPQTTGWVSADGSMFVAAHVPGSTADRQTGLMIAMKPASRLNLGTVTGRYNGVMYMRGDGSFGSGLAYMDFNGSGGFAGKITAVSKSKTGAYLSTGDLAGTYSVSAGGWINAGGNMGFVSADGSTIVIATVAQTGDYQNGILILTRAPAATPDSSIATPAPIPATAIAAPRAATPAFSTRRIMETIENPGE